MTHPCPARGALPPLSLRLRPLALALACAGLLPLAGRAQVPATTLPTGFAPVAGGVSLGAAPANVLNIQQSTERGIVQWSSFSIGSAATVNVAQPSASSVLLNRVLTGGPVSEIHGRLNANGRVFLVNQAGVLFGPTAVVDVGGLVASTLQMRSSDSAFMQGTESFDFERLLAGEVEAVNEGSLTAAGPGGTVALIGARVINSGDISTPGGTTALVGAGRITLDFAGDGLTSFKVSPDLYGSVLNSGRLQADGGRVVMMSTALDDFARGVVNSGGLVRAHTLESRRGEIVLDSGDGTAGVVLLGGAIEAVGATAGLAGGSVEIRGRTIGAVASVPVNNNFNQVAVLAVVNPVVLGPGLIDAGGAAGGGRIELRAHAVAGLADTGAIALGPNVALRADATQSGQGGDVRVLAERTLRAYNLVTAHGGPQGGNGGFIETSGGFALPAGELNGGIELTGLRTSATAPEGQAGAWLIDPYNVTIVNGVAAGSLPAQPFAPIANSVVQDGDINAALNAGTSVRITTGVGGDPTQGDIVMNNGVRIERNTGGGPLSFQLDAHRSVRSDSDVVIASTGLGGPLNVVFNADVNGAGAAVGGGQVSFSGSILSNGGSVTMNGAWANSSNFMCSVCLTAATLDTRAGNSTVSPGVYSGGSDAGAGGAVALTGRSTGLSGGGQAEGAVLLRDTSVSTATGDITVFGSHTASSGVQIESPQGVGGIATTSGNVQITGTGVFTPNSAERPGHGVVINATPVTTIDGDIAVRGLRAAGPPGDPGVGVLIRNGSLLQTTGSGDIEVTGQHDGEGAGVELGGVSPFLTAAAIDGNLHVVLRAVNDGSSDALVIDGSVRAGVALNLRPGGTDALGAPQDRSAVPITVGGTAATGVAVSAAELDRVNTPQLVFGSNGHAADITVVAVLTTTAALTLQNEGGGNILLNAGVASPQLALLSAGNIQQAPGAAITAASVLARSTGAGVALAEPGNNVASVGGGAATGFAVVNSGALTVGPVAGVGFDAASNLPQALSAGGVNAGTALVRSLAGDLTLTGAVASTGGADLVTAARFQNPGGGSLSGAPWRIWADTWVGESRAGLAGSGALPNLYSCAYLGLCSVSVPAGANHFIYTQQPTANVVVDNAARPGGAANPVFTYSVTGLILGDSGAGVTGTLSTPAVPASPPGGYAINGSFVSAEGYALTVTPGLLTVGSLPSVLLPDLLRELPTTWLYDRNLTPPAMCFANAPLDGDLTAATGDVLANEWSKVRSRPNVSNCLDSGRTNGCGDF